MEHSSSAGVNETPISRMRMRILNELYVWESMTGKKLPLYANTIADIEMAGGVVDLETGEVFYPKDEECKR